MMKYAERKILDAYSKDISKKMVISRPELRMMHSQPRLIWLLPVSDDVRLEWIERAQRKVREL